MTEGSDSWGEYSKLVLKELETLAAGIKELNESLNDMKREMADIKEKSNKLQEVIEWKGRIDEVASPTQLKELRAEVDALNTFKITSVAIFTFVQFLMGFILFYIDIFK
jgi:predicted nuclease with TOPRIM domain